MMKKIPGFPGYYVTRRGRVYSRRCGALYEMAPGKNSRGYLHVTLVCAAKPCTRSVHRLVLETFVGPCLPLHSDCDHINGIRDDNHVENLRWVTHAENVRASFRRRRAA